MADSDVLPAPAQLEAQLGKCKSVRPPTYYKSRVKTAAVSTSNLVLCWPDVVAASHIRNTPSTCCCTAGNKGIKSQARELERERPQKTS